MIWLVSLKLYCLWGNDRVVDLLANKHGRVTNSIVPIQVVMLRNNKVCNWKSTILACFESEKLIEAEQ